ncbi:MAG: M64 family metallopeptidase, partial [Clostridiales bacterium]|nr:M64 family metallopeptidase [Clostridiales bacterium]
TANGASVNVFFNTDTYGGRGGNPAYTALSWGFLDVAVHELAHSVIGLGEEYVYGSDSQLSSAKSGPFGYSSHSVFRTFLNHPTFLEYSSWTRLLGKNGTTFHPWREGMQMSPDYADFFRPAHNCKMRFVGDSDILKNYDVEEFPFCEVCKEAIRDRLCILSKVPVLHFQPYNDQFYSNKPVLLNNKNFIIRVPEREPMTNNRLGKKTFAEQLGVESVNGVLGTLRFTVFDSMGVALPQYSNIPVSTPLNLAVGTYKVAATFTGSYNSVPYTLTLKSLENEFEVKPASIIAGVGKYAEPWNSHDNMDTLTRSWIKDTPVTLPALIIDPLRLHEDATLAHFDITYSWHVRNFDGSAGQQLGITGIYGETPIDGPTAGGQYILAIHSRAKAIAPTVIANYNMTNEFPFDIEVPWHEASHYVIDGGTYSHETIAHDFRGITIVGEGFTEDEQDKFEALAEDFITKFLDTDPVKRVAERFCFYIQNTMSPDSGITHQGEARKDSYYGFQLNRDNTLGTYRTDMPMDLIIYREAWRRDTNMKIWAQWGATVVLINEEDIQANYHWRHPEANRSVSLATIADSNYQRLIESLVAQFANVRSQRQLNLLDTYRWAAGPEQNVSFNETVSRLVESCYSHEMYGSGTANLPRPVIYSEAALKRYVSDGTAIVDEAGVDIEASFRAFSYGHELWTNTATANTFTFQYFSDNGHRVGTRLTGKPTENGFYWVQAHYPTGAKQYKGLHIDSYLGINNERPANADRYGFTYNDGVSLPGRNGIGTSNSTNTRGFVRFEIASAAITITTQPAAHTTVNQDNTCTLQVAATVEPNAPLSYQWYSNTIKSNTAGTAIAGATDTFLIVPTSNADTFYYYCVVSAPGANPLNSDVAKVTVNKVDYNYHIYLAPHASTINSDDTLLVDIMLKGDINYAQFSAEITYDDSILKYEAYDYLRGWVAAVSSSGTNKVAVRSIPTNNMVVGAPCSPEVLIATLKFKVVGNIPEESLDTELNFSQALALPAGNISEAFTAPANPATITILQSWEQDIMANSFIPEEIIVIE